MRGLLSIFRRLVPTSGRWLKPMLLAFLVLFSITWIHLLSDANPVRVAVFGPAEPQYYQRDTASFFPPPRTEATDGTDPCAGFPTELLDSIQVVIKTGIGEIQKAEANLKATSACLRNAIVVADVDTQVGEHHAINILADLPPSYRKSDPKFDTYSKEREASERGEKVDFTHDGWQMDRLKFLPMVDRTYQMRPNATWYVFTEADAYVFWDTMFRFISQYDPDEKLYLGSAVRGKYRTPFAYGGASYVISRALMRDLYDGGAPPLAVEYEDLAVDNCCGDAVLGYAISRRTGIRVKGLYPMFSGEEIVRLRMNEEKWCVPLISVHRANPQVMDMVWTWERTRPYTDKPLLYSDTLYMTHKFLKNETRLTNWDNYSDVKLSFLSKAHKSVEDCEQRCFDDDNCWQYLYAKKKCQLGKFLEKGHAVAADEGEYISGWNLKKILARGFNPDDTINHTCNETHWKAPNQRPV